MVGKAESVHALADKQADESKSKKIRRLEAGLSIREYVSQPKQTRAAMKQAPINRQI